MVQGSSPLQPGDSQRELQIYSPHASNMPSSVPTNPLCSCLHPQIHGEGHRCLSEAEVAFLPWEIKESSKERLQSQGQRSSQSSRIHFSGNDLEQDVDGGTGWAQHLPAGPPKLCSLSKRHTEVLACASLVDRTLLLQGYLQATVLKVIHLHMKHAGFILQRARLSGFHSDGAACSLKSFSPDSFQKGC